MNQCAGFFRDTGEIPRTGELFLIGFGTVVAFAVLSEPLGRWALPVFPIATAALIRLHLRRARPRR